MAEATLIDLAAAEAATANALPLGRRVPRGTVRWYLVRCREGQELSACADVARLVPEDLLKDAFVPRKEQSAKRQGSWKSFTVPLFKGYFVVATGDAPALAKALSFLSTPVEMVGQVGRGYAPIAREAQDFLASAMDRSHVIRTSYATVDRDGLHVTYGPLRGQERRISNFESRKRYVRVAVGSDAHDGQSFSVTLPIDIQVARKETGEPIAEPTAHRRFSGTSLPMGRRTPRGRLRWYLVECPEGTEEESCEAVRRAVSAYVLTDAYVPRVEKVKKVHGEWVKPVASLVTGCFAVATIDSAALKVELEKTGLPLRLVGQGQGFQPLDDDAWGFVESFMDGTRTIRESQGEIVGDQLHVWSGPLAGRESVVKRYLRRQSLAFVDLGTDQAGEHTLLMPLSILARR